MYEEALYIPNLLFFSTAFWIFFAVSPLQDSSLCALNDFSLVDLRASFGDSSSIGCKSENHCAFESFPL